MRREKGRERAEKLTRQIEKKTSKWASVGCSEIRAAGMSFKLFEFVSQNWMQIVFYFVDGGFFPLRLESVILWRDEYANYATKTQKTEI